MQEVEAADSCDPSAQQERKHQGSASRTAGFDIGGCWTTLGLCIPGNFILCRGKIGDSLAWCGSLLGKPGGKLTREILKGRVGGLNWAGPHSVEHAREAALNAVTKLGQKCAMGERTKRLPG